MPFKFTKSYFLLCEGDDDKGFLETLINEYDELDNLILLCQK